jgi:P-type E1-E2 ATPase
VVLEDDESGRSGLIRLGDTPRDDARQAVAMLQRAGVETVLLSGDHPDVTERIGRAVGVDQAFGGLDPEGKAAWLETLDGPAMFVGDGLNDGVALAAADVGLAMHSGVTASLLVADGVVTQPALRPVVAAIAGARATQSAVKANLVRALVYNAAAVTAAFAGLINPLVAAILMPLSSAWVIWGAMSVDRRLADLEKPWTSC